MSQYMSTGTDKTGFYEVAEGSAIEGVYWRGGPIAQDFLIEEFRISAYLMGPTVNIDASNFYVVDDLLTRFYGVESDSSSLTVINYGDTFTVNSTASRQLHFVLTPNQQVLFDPVSPGGLDYALSFQIRPKGSPSRLGILAATMKYTLL